MILSNLAFEIWIQAARLFNRERRNAFYAVLFGGPGAGKGTVAAKLAPRLGVPTLDFGKIIRNEMKTVAEFRDHWKPEVDAGRLIPDEVVMSLIFRELSKPDFYNGAVIDGLRTKEQAIMLRKRLARWGNRMDVAVFLDCPEPDMIERLSLRRTCSNNTCKSGTYHVKFSPPKVDGKCDLCGSDLYERDDQKPEALKVRLAEFNRTFAPMKGYMEELGILRTVISTNQLGPDQVYEEVLFAIDEVD